MCEDNISIKGYCNQIYSVFEMDQPAIAPYLKQRLFDTVSKCLKNKDYPQRQIQM